MKKNKINIIQVSFGRYPLPYKGSGGDNIVYLMSELLSKNESLEVGLIDFKSKKHKNIKCNFKIYEVPNFIYWDDNDFVRIPKAILFTFSVAICILLICIRKKIDIIHFHNQFSATAGIILKKIFGLRYKTVYTVHSVELMFPAPINLFKAPLELFVLKHVDYIIAITPSLYKTLIKRYKVVSNKVRQIFLGVEKIEPEKYLYRNQKKYKINITYVSRISTRKNQLTLLKALKIIVDKYPDIVCNLVGLIDDKTYYNNLKKYIEENGLLNNVIFWGAVSREKLFEILVNSYLSVMTSTFETQGLMLIESLMCGVPVVASNIGPFKDIIELNPNVGVLVDPYDYESFSKGIIEILDNENIRNTMSKEAKKISNRFSWENITAEVFDLYREIFKQQNKKT